MYNEEDELELQYLLENDLENDEFKEAAVGLLDRAHRKQDQWRRAVRREKPVDEVDQIAREMAEAAYVVEKMASNAFESYGDLGGDKQLEIVNLTRGAWRSIHETGTQMQYEGKDSDEMSKEDFVLINGNNVDYSSEEFEDLETYTPPSEYLEDFSKSSARFSSVVVDPRASIENRRNLFEAFREDF